jgi:hypothetical protein
MGRHDPGRYVRVRLHNAGVASSARRRLRGAATPVPFLCECDDEGCREFVRLALPDYDRLRDGELFITAADHVIGAGLRLSATGGHAVHSVSVPRAGHG